MPVEGPVACPAPEAPILKSGGPSLSRAARAPCTCCYARARSTPDASVVVGAGGAHRSWRGGGRMLASMQARHSVREPPLAPDESGAVHARGIVTNREPPCD